MLRNLLLISLSATALFAQQTGTTAHPQTAPVPTATAAKPPIPVQPPQPVAPDAPVITIHGLCPESQAAIGQKVDSCSVVLTRAQFESMINSVNLNGQNFTPAALRNMATSYVTIMSLADAGEKAGVEKDPRFVEYMKVARGRGLAEAYRRSLEDKYGKPSDAEIEDYYKQNISKFEQSKIDRILVPKVNPLRSQDKPAEFEKKARALADQIHERAARGEDFPALQAEVYKTLGIQAMPPQTELNPTQIRVMQGTVRNDVNALKPGEVTRVEIELSGLNIYKLRSKSVLSLEQVKTQVIRELTQKNVDAALKAATGAVHADFNEQFFNPRGYSAPLVPGITPRSLPPGTVSHGAQIGSAPRAGSSAPAGASGNPAPQTPAAPKQ